MCFVFCDATTVNGCFVVVVVEVVIQELTKAAKYSYFNVEWEMDGAQGENGL